MEADQLPCAGKLRFETRREAEAAVVVIEHQRGTKLKAYACRYCDWWHLASA